MDVKQFIKDFREAFGQKAALPLLFGYSDQPVADTERINGCFKRAEKPYLNFVRIDQAESFDGFEGIMFYATPDMLSGLCGWAFFDSNAADAVVTQFGSGCSTVVSMTIVENARQGQRCFLGLFDPSVRPYVGPNELSFTIPMSRFKNMTETMKECFLFDSHAWKKVKARLEE